MYLYLLIVIACMLSASAYLIRSIIHTVPKAFVIGMIILTLGYTLLSIAKTYQLELEYQATRENFKEKRQHFISFLAYFTIFIFFIIAYLVKNMTPHRRWYDIFALLGFGFMSLVHAFYFKKLIPLSIIFLILYYFFGAINKLAHLDFINIIQMISRFIFFIFYSFALYDNSIKNFLTTNQLTLS